MKKILLVATAAALVASCDKKQVENGSTNTEQTTTANGKADNTSTVTPLDSTTALNETSTTAPTASTRSTSAAGERFNHVSHDGKTKFSALYDADKGTAIVKNETSGRTYNMKTVPSGSGAKYADSEGYYFWEHQGEFYFGKGDQDLVTGVKSK